VVKECWVECHTVSPLISFSYIYKRHEPRRLYMYERYATVTLATAATHTLIPHDGVLLIPKANNADTVLYTFAEGAPRGMNGNVMRHPAGPSGATGPALTIKSDADANATPPTILPIQIKGTEALAGHNVYLLHK
jgi:hypothetical protein